MNAGRQSFIVSAIICLLMAALFVARYRLAPYPVEAPFEGGMPLAALLTRFSVAWPWIAAACAAVVVLWALLVVVQLTIKYAPAASRNYLPSQIFLVGAVGIVVSGEALAALLAAWLTVLSARQFIFSLHKDYRFSEVFHAGFYLGVVPLLYAPAAVVVVPTVLAALVIYRRTGREAIVCFVGLLLPVAAAWFIHWAAGDGGGLIWHELWRCAMEPRAVGWPVSWSAAAAAAPVLILVCIAIVWALSHRKSVRKTQYKFVQHTSFFLLMVAVSAALPGASITLAAIAAVLCALCVPYAFQGKAAAVATTVYCFILVAVVALDFLAISGISVP